ncbi:MAG: Trk family potassium uptake protein [Dehalococcoidia bacterium]|nr:Trk family potassium uptake protein [Dehalococcoidia bacterium]
MHAGVPHRGERPGDVRIRRGRRRSRTIEVTRPRGPRRDLPAVLYLIIGFLGLILVGTALLLLPFATRSGDQASLMTALFTATSAACVTGLVVVDTYDFWSPFGQAVILALIQLGGLGFMSGSTLLLLLLGRRISYSQRMFTGEVLGRLGTERVTTLLKRILLMTVIVEGFAAVGLIVFFSIDANEVSANQVWRGAFTGISAFNNAGFDLEGGFRSMTEFQGNPFVLGTIAATATIGATGYAVVSDVWRERRWRRLELNSKIVLLTSGLLAAIGAAVILTDYIFPGGTYSDDPAWMAVLGAIVESLYARTSGFTAVEVGAVRDETLLFMSGLMFIGGASGSTAGGIKIQTFSSLLFAIVASLRGDEHVHAFDREIPWRQVNRALSIALLSVAFVFAITFALSHTTDRPMMDVLFEVVSAFATCGLSVGMTPETNDAARAILVLAMFVGRLGPLTIALALAARFGGPERLRFPEADITIG